MNLDARFDVCVVSAKADEVRHISNIFNEYFGDSIIFKNGLLYEKQGKDRRIKTIYLVTCGQQGNIYSGVTVSEVVSRHNPSLLIFTGTAGSLNPAMLRIGDVVIPRAVQSRMYERLVSEGERDYKTYLGSGRLLEAFHKDSILIPMIRTEEIGKRNLAFFAKYNSRFDHLTNLIRSEFDGIRIENINIPEPYNSILGRKIEIVDDIEIFTCDLLINSESYRTFINGEVHTKVCAIDTESYGHLVALRSVSNSEISPYSLIIRGISDYAGRRSENTKDSRWNSIANRNAALVTAEIISQHLGFKE